MAAWRKQAIKLVEKTLVHFKAQTSLEVGCDDAGISRKLALKYPDIFFEGVDYRKDKIEQANHLKDKSNQKNVKFNYDYFLNNNDNKKKYDIVIFTEVYEHLVAENQIFALRLIGNLLSKDGVLIFTCPNGDYFFSHLRRSKTFSEKYDENFFKNMYQTDHWLEPTHSEIKKIFISLGFNIKESGYFNLPKRRYLFIEKIELVINKLPILRQWIFKSQYIVASKNPKSPLLKSINLY
jgi:2-polyprenyl-3-methyl-5-hydroxy-6-metoxy-1,4-benzoquinol methylase